MKINNWLTDEILGAGKRALREVLALERPEDTGRTFLHIRAAIYAPREIGGQVAQGLKALLELGDGFWVGEGYDADGRDFERCRWIARRKIEMIAQHAPKGGGLTSGRVENPAIQDYRGGVMSYMSLRGGGIEPYDKCSHVIIAPTGLTAISDEAVAARITQLLDPTTLGYLKYLMTEAKNSAALELLDIDI